jgi:methionyl aminopeptidase
MSVGTRTDEIDAIVHAACVERDCYPSPLNYYGFPKSCCTSVNEVICHGIPDQRPLLDGDICNVDVTVYHRGYHGDLNETFLVGDNVGKTARRLVNNTWECLQKAIQEGELNKEVQLKGVWLVDSLVGGVAVKPGTKYRDIGNVIQKHAQSQGFSVVRSYCGHGIHRLFHTTPSIPHYASSFTIHIRTLGQFC